jgi:four helix bundle protein
MVVRNYKELIVWQKAMDLVTVVYEATRYFPQSESFGLTQHLRRAAVSIPSNIAEGQGRQSTRDFLHFLSIAHGSLQEMETQIILTCRLDYLDENRHQSLLDRSTEVARLINGLSNSVNRESSV